MKSRSYALRPREQLVHTFIRFASVRAGGGVVGGVGLRVRAGGGVVGGVGLSACWRKTWLRVGARDGGATVRLFFTFCSLVSYSPIESSSRGLADL